MSTRFQPLKYAQYLRESGKYAEEGGLLYEWNEVYWKALSTTQSERMALSWVSAHQEEFASDRTARTAVGTALLHVPPLPAATGAVLIPCQNGYVLADDEGLRLVPANPDYEMKFALKCKYDPVGPPPSRFLAFLDEVIPDRAIQDRLQEYAGYTLTHDTRHQRAQMWIGRGANGKGVLANILQALHGDFASADLGRLDGFHLSGLVGASLIYVDEAPKGKIDENQLKSIIAGEAMHIDRKYLAPITVRLRGKWIVLGNHMPKISDQSDGYWRRWDIVPFDVQIPEHQRDPRLAETIINNELSGVLRWALEGLMRLQARGKFNPVLPAAMERMLATAKTDTSPIRAWIEDRGVFRAVDGQVTRKDDIYGEYRDWAKMNGMTALGAPQFWVEMKDVFHIDECRRRVAGSGQVRFCNICVPDVPSIQG